MFEIDWVRHIHGDKNSDICLNYFRFHLQVDKYGENIIFQFYGENTGIKEYSWCDFKDNWEVYEGEGCIYV